MTTPAKTLQINRDERTMGGDQKAAILMAIAQLDMLVRAFATAPERVLSAAKEFKASLEEWANG